MAEADVRLTTVSKDGGKMSEIIPSGSQSKADGKRILAGKWQIPGGPVTTLTVSGSSVVSAEAHFGSQKFMGEIEEGTDLFGLHVTMGGFPMKAWLTKDGAADVLCFSNGGRWSKM